MGFQPTLPMRGATLWEHIPQKTRSSFNPHSPCGERRRHPCADVKRLSFQPTLPLRGATSECVYQASSEGFQPTLPMRGATKVAVERLREIKFQPTLPMRGATFGRLVAVRPTDVSTHTPHAGSDRNIVYYELIKSVYIVLDMIC